MDKQNNSEVDNKQPLQDSTIQTPLNQVENIKKAGSKPPKFLVPALIGSVILIFAIGGLFLFKSNRSSHKANLTNTQQQTVPTSSEQATQTQTTLDALFASLNSTYNGNIPWTNINNRIAYKFYPKEIIGFPIAGNQLAINYDENYNPLTVFNLTESITIPLKNALAGLYEIPTVLNSKFNLSDTDYVIPLELKAYEFNRKLNEDEKSILVKGENFSCTNEKTKTEIAFFSNSQLILNYCNLNLTDEQKIQVKNKGFFDKVYEIYFVDRNILILFSIDSNYINNPQDYLSDYLLKIFNSDDALFVSQDQVRTIEESRKFRELRNKVFDKK